MGGLFMGAKISGSDNGLWWTEREAGINECHLWTHNGGEKPIIFGAENEWGCCPWIIFKNGSRKNWI
jgi:hypothetical protein